MAPRGFTILDVHDQVRTRCTSRFEANPNNRLPDLYPAFYPGFAPHSDMVSISVTFSPGFPWINKKTPRPPYNRPRGT